MSNMDQISKLVGSLLSENPNERNEGEKNIENLAETNPEEFLKLNMEILKNNTLHPNVRAMSVLLLKKYLTVGKDKKNLYLKISDLNLLSFQKNIMLILAENENKENKILTKRLTDLIAAVAGSIYENQENINFTEIQKWSNLLQNIFELFSTNEKTNIMSSLEILEGLFEKTKDKLSIYKNDFIQLFKVCLKNSDLEIKIKGMNCLLSLILNFKTTHSKDFKIFGPTVLNIISEIVSKNDIDLLNNEIGQIFDICEKYPGYFKKIFPNLLKVMTDIINICNYDENSNLKIQSVESLIFCVERYGDLFNEESIKKQVVELVFKVMLDIEDDISDDWKSPPDGFNEDLEEDDDQSIIKMAMEFINRLISSVGYKSIIPFLSKYIVEMLQNNDWKMKNAAILTISQIGEYIDDKNEIKNMVDIISTQITSTNPRIRYACCHVLGQLAEDLSPDFQQNFHKEFFKITLPLLEDPVPRVVSHCLAAMTNFLEDTSSEQINPHFAYIYTKIRFWLENGIGFVKEICLSTLSALAESSKLLFMPIYNEVMELLLHIIANVKAKEYKAIKGAAIECITLIGNEFGKDLLAPYIDKLIKELITIQSNEIEMSEYDPQKYYILSAWQRLCMLLRQDLLPYVEKILPSLLNLALEPLKTQQDERTSESEDTDLSIQLIELFMNCFPNKLSNYIKELYELMLLVNKKVINSETRLSAVNCLPKLIKVAKLNSNCDFLNLAKSILAKVWEIFVNEEDSSYKSSYCLNIQEIIENSGILLNEQELFNFIKQCEEELRKVEKRRKEILDSIDFDEEKPEIANFNIKFENTLEDECKLEIANIFGKIFKVYKENSLSSFNYLYQNHIIPSLENNKQLINISYALFLIDDAIEFIGDKIDPTTLQDFYKILLSYITHKSTDIRQPAMYGMGILVKSLQNFGPHLDNTIKTLCQGIEIKDCDNIVANNLEKCRDNGVSAIGKVLQTSCNIDRNSLEQYLHYWLKKLPIVNDYKEGEIMHEMMIDILEKEPMVLLGNNYCYILDVINVFQKVFKRDKISNTKINMGIDSIMKKFVSDENIKMKLMNSQVSQEQKEFISSFN